jgi:hypothetical protein
MKATKEHEMHESMKKFFVSFVDISWLSCSIVLSQ